SRAAEVAKKAGHTALVLPVPCAYHSPLMAAAARIFADRLPAMQIHSARITVVSTASARYIRDAAEIRQNIAEEAPTAFVEIGPNQVLTKLHQQILADQSFKVMIASDNPRAGGL